MKRKCRNSNRTNRTGDAIFELNGNVYSLIAEPENQMAEKKTTGVKRVHRGKDKEDIIAALTSEQVGVFKEIWRLLLFAAQVGFQEKRRDPLASVDSGKGIDQSTFGNCPSWPGVSYLLTLVENCSSDSLSGAPEAEDTRLEVFQEYANGGLSVIREYFRDRIIDLDSVLSFIDMRSRTVSQEPDLDLSI
jgi:dnd system-associated protein 4